MSQILVGFCPRYHVNEAYNVRDLTNFGQNELAAASKIPFHTGFRGPGIGIRRTQCRDIADITLLYRDIGDLPSGHRGHPPREIVDGFSGHAGHESYLSY